MSVLVYRVAAVVLFFADTNFLPGKCSVYTYLCFLLILGPTLSKEELRMLTVGEIVQELIKAQKEGRDVNLNKLKTRISSKYGLSSSPRLVDIIAAVPQEHKKVLLPKLRAKPVRTASGVSFLRQIKFWLDISLKSKVSHCYVLILYILYTQMFRFHGVKTLLKGFWYLENFENHNCKECLYNGILFVIYISNFSFLLMLFSF